MHYFVTGATGLVGRYLTSLLLAEGHSVTALVRSRDQAAALADYGVRPHMGDVRDKESMRRGLRGAEGLFHTDTWARIGSRDRATATAVNVGGTRNVLELVSEMQVPKAVLTGTIEVFGDTAGRRLPPGHRHGGPHLCLADRTRWEAYHEVAVPAMRSGAPVVAVQCGLLYGPGDASETARLLRRYLRGRVPVVPTRTAASWVHVEDAARGHLLAMEEGVPGRTYVLGGEDRPLLGVVRAAGRLVGKRRGPIPVPGGALRAPAAVLGALGAVVPPLRAPAARLRRRAGVTFLGDDTASREELGYEPRGLAEGLPDTVRSLLEDLFETG
ncbi:MAG: NAD-dependent epimerase/dehydratase family protein [Actinobacteria bacterium]|nr:NAD-dependent epimerase/dehydratase family protein [Actinomycetota bacterium]